MANAIKDKFGPSVPLTITLASLANLGGRQSTFVDNTTDRFQDLLVFVNVKMNASIAPNANSIVEVYLLRSDDNSIEHRDDGAGASDAGLTPLNAQLIGALRNSGVSLVGDVLKGSLLVHRPGPKWGIAVFNRTGQAFHSAGSSHWVRYVGLNPEVQ